MNDTAVVRYLYPSKMGQSIVCASGKSLRYDGDVVWGGLPRSRIAYETYLWIRPVQRRP